MLTLGIAVPCYKDHIPKLYQMLDSIEQQTVKPHMVIVSCSSYSSVEGELEAQKYSFPLTIITSQNKHNAAMNRNIAMNLLNTDIISFFDADDIMHPQRTELILNAFIKTKCDFLLHSHISPAELEQGEDFTNLSSNALEDKLVINNLCRAPTGCATFVNPLLITNGVNVITHGMNSVSRKFLLEHKIRYREGKEHERYNEDSIFCGEILERNPTNVYLSLKLCKYYQSGVTIKCGGVGLKKEESKKEESKKEETKKEEIKKEETKKEELKKEQPRKENRRIFIFWTGTNPLSPNRLRCIEDIKAKVGVPVVLVTWDTLMDWVVPEYPIHPAYPHLSSVHKADYLRCYFMHVYGGGYTDIKRQTGSWESHFDRLEQSDAYALGYQEVKDGAALIKNRQLYELMNQHYTKLIGNGAYIFKSYTPLTHAWFNQLHNILDNKLAALRQHPAMDHRDAKGHLINGVISNYPIEWSEILGQILHPLIFTQFLNKVLQGLPMPSFNDYL
jgi:glycosyltransferase involved in cell wall biosynthesis